MAVSVAVSLEVMGLTIMLSVFRLGAATSLLLVGMVETFSNFSFSECDLLCQKYTPAPTIANAKTAKIHLGDAFLMAVLLKFKSCWSWVMLRVTAEDGAMWSK